MMLLFGKHNGEHVEDIAEDDPGYLRWLVDQTWADEELREAAAFALEASSGRSRSIGRVVRKAGGR